MPDDSPLPSLPGTGLLLGIVAAFFALTFVVYGPSLHNQFVAWDDTTLIYSQPVIKNISWTNTKQAFSMYDPELYIPLTFLSYQFDYAIGQLNPFYYHLHNLLQHTVSALAVAWIGYLLSRKKCVGLICGLLFAIHPLHTEAVVWASARKDTLSTVFFLTSIISYLYYTRQNRTVGARHGSTSSPQVAVPLLYVLSILLFILGLFAKVMVLTLPVVLLLIDFQQQGRLTKRNLTDKIPYFALSIALGIVALLGKEQALVHSTLTQKILMAFKSTAFYLEKIFAPVDLTAIYPYVKPITIGSPDFWMPMAGIIALSVFLLWLIARLHRNDQGRLAMDIFFGCAFFLITLCATFINFAKGEDFYFASDRYAYIPSIGIFYAVACALWTWSSGGDSLVRERRNITVLLSGSAIAVVTLAVLASAQGRTWYDTKSLMIHATDLYPEAYAAHVNLAIAERETGEFDKALAELEKAKAVKENVNTYTNIAAVYKKMGDTAKAEEQYHIAAGVDPADAMPHFGLGILFAEENRFNDAVAEYKKAIELEPLYTAVYNDLGSLYEQQGKLDEAAATYQKAITINPRFSGLYYNLGVVEEQQKKYTEAIADYQKAIELEPLTVDAYTRLAAVYLATGQNGKALDSLKQALAIDKENADAKGILRQMVEAGIIGTK